MKKYFKKIGILLMAFLMMAVMCIPVMAAKPSAADTSEVRVSNVEQGVTVTAYQIVQAEYNVSGFINYKPVDGVNIVDLMNPTENEITTIASGIIATPTSTLKSRVLTWDEQSSIYKGNVEAGTWLVLVTKSSTRVYNPMIVSASYSKAGSDNTMQGGTVDGLGKYADTAYAKSTSPTVVKSIVNPGSQNASGDDAAIGDIVSFKIETTIPSYSAAYKTPTFTIKDTLSNGFDNATQVEVKDDQGNLILADAYTMTAVDNKIEINFTSEYILQNGLKKIVVTYQSKLNEKAGLNFDSNTNKVVVIYSNDPATATTGETSSITYHYTFGIDANLNGETGVDTIKTHEIIKVNEDGKITTETIEGQTKEVITGQLAGATFELRQEGKKARTAISDKDGYLSFTGLDAGTYTLVETAAPDGYALNNQEHTVVITPTYNEDGTLQKYLITIDGKSTATYTATYKGGTIEKIETSSETTLIKNTKLSSLPSTGGMGTYVFTITGVLIMALAAGLYFINRRRKVEK